MAVRALSGTALPTAGIYWCGHQLYAVASHEARFTGTYLEQGTGIEPASSAWEADVLPMYEPCILEIIKFA